MSKILIVDDEQSIIDSINMILSSDYSVDSAIDGKTAVSKVKANPYDLVLLDIKMPRMDGLEVLEKIKEINKETVVIMISGHGTIETAVEATKKGAYNFLQKPLPDLHELKLIIKNAIDYKHSKDEINLLKEQIIEENKIIGSSPRIKEVKQLIEKYSNVNSNVLICGESGTGKEIAAREIHFLSTRKDCPFIQINCANLSQENVELKLFGGIDSENVVVKGALEEADKGTLFVDEVSDLTLEVQTKLLRIIETNSISRVGSNTTIQIDTRFIFSTNGDLLQEVADKKFREELYHRINVLKLDLPPLREIPEDIEELVKYFVKRISKNNSIPIKRFSENSINLLRSFRFAGNVRELKNLVERLIITLDTQVIEAEDIEIPGSRHSKLYNELFYKDLSLNQFQNDSEKIFLLKVLNDYKFNMTRAAEALQIQRSHLYNLMNKYEIHRPVKK
ncbi:sigma-54 dependent transcriptional regulator [soil metagenome]